MPTSPIAVSSSTATSGQVIHFTARGTADWIATGNIAQGCVGGPYFSVRKLGGSGLIGPYAQGSGDPRFYGFSPNLVNLSWSDAAYSATPDGTASHINNTTVQLQAFAGKDTRTLTLIAGILYGGNLTATIGISDGVTVPVVHTDTFTQTGVNIITITFQAASEGHQLSVALTHSGGEVIIYGAALAGAFTPGPHQMALTNDLQGFVDASRGGDTLNLPDGYSWTGHLILPVRADAGWVTIQGTVSMPQGVRVKPGDLKATLVAPDELPVIQNDFANPDHRRRPTHGWRFIGVEVTANNQRAGLNYNLIALLFGDAPTVADICHDIDFDRCYIHGDGNSNYIRGIMGNANNITVQDCYMSGFVSSFAEANAINIYSSNGPINLVNNYFEASGENVMIGGSGPDVGPVLVPTNGLIQHNYFYKPLSWRGGAFIVKNLLEFKDGYNFLVDSNVFENCWQAAQTGFALLITPRTAGGTPANHVDNITYTNNIIRHAGSGISLGLYDDLAVDGSGNPIPPSQLAMVHDVTFRNNLFDDLSVQYSSFSHGMLVNGPPVNLLLDHNTFRFSENTNDHGWWLQGNTGLAPTNAVITNNDFGANLAGDSRNFAPLTGAAFVNNNILNADMGWLNSPYAADNTFDGPASPSQGANVTELLANEPFIKNGYNTLSRFCVKCSDEC
jgi:hypothetical protein